MSEIKDSRLKGLSLTLNYKIFTDQLGPEGFLADDKACHACWYFYLCAESNRRQVGKSIEDQIIEYDAENNIVPLWNDKRYNAIAKSIAILYGLESPDVFAKFWPNVKLEARRLNLPAPADEYVNLAGEDIIL